MLKAGLELMALGRQAGGGTVELKDVRRLVSTYFTAALLPGLGHALPRRTVRELRTIAEALDCFLSSRVPEAEDILIRRSRTLETAAANGTWELARHM